MSTPDSFIQLLMGRGLPSDLSQRIGVRFPDWEALCGANAALLAEHFAPAELDAIRRAKMRREISSDTVNRLIAECGFRCCLCWNIDSDSGLIIHHIHPHATSPDDRYENLVVLCIDHHDKVHTKRELTRHPYPPELLLHRKASFSAAITAFKEGKRVAPGREKNTESELLVAPPLPPPHFIGRDVLARDIAKALDAQNGRAAVVGMGGIGKTALALKVADTYRKKFPGGILWAEVATDFGGTPGMLRAWIKSLGHDVTGMEIDEQLALFGGLLTKRTATDGRLLLLIDGAIERIAKDLVKLSSYVPPEVSILMTTRDETVSAALGANQFRVEPLERADCRQLLESVSGSALIRKEVSSVETLLSLLGDLPLAVELVARQIAMRERKPAFNIAGLCQRLGEFEPQILSFPGHRGIAMSFALSYEHLDDNEQRVFRSFGIFNSVLLHTDSVAAVVAAREEETESTLDRLVTVSVLNWGTGVGDYRLHPLLHKYAEFLFGRTDDSEQSSTRIRFYRHYTSMATKLSRNAPDNLQAIDRILPNLTKAINCAAANEDHSAVAETVLSLCAQMGFFTSRNLERESMPLLEMAIVAAKHLGDRDCESACVGHLGTAFSRLGMIREALSQYERAISIARKTGNDHDLASHLQNLGTTLLAESKDLRRAEQSLHEALKAAERSHNADVVIGCLSTLGTLHREVGNLKDSARLYAGALEASRLAGDRLSEGNNLSNLGLVTDQLGDPTAGERMIREALAIAVEIGDRRGEGNRNGHLGGILVKKAQHLPLGPERYVVLESACGYIVTAIRRAQETGDTEKAATWLMNLGNVSLLRGKFTEGIDRFEKALEAAVAGGFARLEAQARFNLGSALARQSEFQLALVQFRAASVLFRNMRSPKATEAEAYISRLNGILTKRDPV